MLETLNLGSFSLMTKHNDVNLSTAVSASATLSHDGSTNLQHLLNSESTNEQIVDKLAWVRQSHVLVLNLHIYVNGFGLHREEEQQIRKTVMHAKVSCMLSEGIWLTIIPVMESIASSVCVFIRRGL